MKKFFIIIISLIIAIITTALIIPDENKKSFLKKDTTQKNKHSNNNEFRYCTEVRVEGNSMQPTLQPNQRVCAYQEEPQVNDLVVFKCKNCGIEHEAIKRLMKIENNCYWVEGDNSKNSFDSREFGFLCKDNLEYIWKVEKIDKY